MSKVWKINALRRLKRRALNDEGGFTLAEVLVTILMLTMVLFALYNIFDMSLRVFSVGNDKVEATENARVAAERMERELRMAYPGNAKNGRTSLLCAGSTSNYCVLTSDTTKIAFGNDLNYDRDVLNCTGPTSCTTHDSGEIISYFSCDYDGDGDLDIVRSSSQTCTNDSSLPALTDLGRDGSLRFSYYTKDGNDLGFAPDCILGPASPCPTSPAALTATSEPKVEMVRIKVNVRVDRGPGEGTLQTLTTDVTLRNRNR